MSFLYKGVCVKAIHYLFFSFCWLQRGWISWWRHWLRQTFMLVMRLGRIFQYQLLNFSLWMILCCWVSIVGQMSSYAGGFDSFLGNVRIESQISQKHASGCQYFLILGWMMRLMPYVAKWETCLLCILVSPSAVILVYWFFGNQLCVV